MPCFNNFVETYFTIQSLRLHHDMSDKEILIIDNYGDPVLENFCKSKGGFNNFEDFKSEYPGTLEAAFNRLVAPGHRGQSISGGRIRYRRETAIQGVSHAKNKIFEHARGEYVLCMDSHILIEDGAFDVEPTDDDMVQGPCYENSVDRCAFEWLPQWRRQMWGIWGAYVKPETLPLTPLPIWAMGAGFFACRRESWLGFNPNFRGFGGETGYIQEKYRRDGRHVLCYPWMRWVHFFGGQGREIPYTLRTSDRIKNYIFGFEELGMDTAEMRSHFGAEAFDAAYKEIHI